MKVRKRSQRKLNRIFTFMALLRLIATGECQVSIARKLRWSKQRVNYWAGLLQKEGLIKEGARSSIVTYEVTSKGKEFLTWSEGAQKWKIFLHNFGLKFPVLISSSEFEALDWRKIVLKNWIKKVLRYHSIEGNFSIELTSRNLIIWCEERSGLHPYQLFFESVRDILRLAETLQTKYNIKLGCPSLARKPHFGIAEPLLRKVSEEVQLTGPEEWINDSPVPGSVEFFDPIRIMQYFMMPEKVDKIEKHLNEVITQMGVFGEGMKKHIELISALQELTESLKEAADSLLKSLTWLNQKG